MVAEVFLCIPSCGGQALSVCLSARIPCSHSCASEAYATRSMSFRFSSLGLLRPEVEMYLCRYGMQDRRIPEDFTTWGRVGERCVGVVGKPFWV